MSSDNDVTIKSYKDHAKEYLATIVPILNTDSKDWVIRALALIPTGGTVLELGSGSDQAATYIESKGYKVIASDVVPEFVDLLCQTGHEARLLNVLTDDFGGGYDMVLADAVLLHFEPEEVRRVLAKTLTSLKPGGIFAFSMKRGSGFEWSQAKINAPRYMYYWEQPELEAVVTKAGFEIIEIAGGTSRTAKWLLVIAKKP